MEYEQRLSKLRKLAALKVRKDNQRDLRLALEHHFADKAGEDISDRNEVHKREI